MAWMLEITRPFAETTKPSTMPVGPARSDAGVTGLVITSTTDTDFACAIEPGGERAATVVARAADDGLLRDALDRPEARVDAPGGEAAAHQTDHRAQHHRRDEPVARPDGRGHSAGAAARCLR